MMFIFYFVGIFYTEIEKDKMGTIIREGLQQQAILQKKKKRNDNSIVKTTFQERCEKQNNGQGTL